MFNRTAFTQADIDSYHWVKFNGQNGEVLYTLSGVILVNTKGDSQHFFHLTAVCTMQIPDLPAGQGLYIHYHAPFAALNSIFNQGQAVNGGHAVDNFELNPVNPHGNFGSKEITLSLKLAVCDSDAILFRVGFTITLTGVFRPLPPVDPCQAEADKLSQLENLCNGGYEALIEQAQQQLQTASPSQKADIVKRIGELKAGLQSCPVSLPAARNALNACRLSHPRGGSVPPNIS